MISILLPTRNRPNNLIRLKNNILETASNINDIELCIYIDDDDVESIPALEDIAGSINTNAVQGNRILGSQMYNELFKISNGDIIMFAADDILFKTPNWDLFVKTKFELATDDKILFIFGNDGFQNGRIGTHGFIHRHWIEILGYVLPPKLASAYTDEWITELSRRVNRDLYCPDLIIEHLHPAIGKAKSDETYTKRIEVAGNIQQYYDSLINDRVADALKLQKFIDLFKD
jgi:hypothetical protein